MFALKLAENPSNAVITFETFAVTDRSVIESQVCCFSDRTRTGLKSENESMYKSQPIVHFLTIFIDITVSIIDVKALK